MPSSSARCSQLPRAEDKLPFYVGLRKLRDFVNGTLYSLNETEITFPDIKIKDTDDVLQKTVIRISNKPFSELSAETLKSFGDKIPSGQMISKHIRSSPSPSSSSSSSNLVFSTEALTTQTMSILHNTTQQQNGNLFNYDSSPQHGYGTHNRNYTPSPPPSATNQQRVSTNGVISSKNSFIENSSSNTNAAVLAALASGGFNSSSSSSSLSQSQPNYYQAAQTVTYSIPSSLTSNTSGKFFLNNCSRKKNRFSFQFPIPVHLHRHHLMLFTILLNLLLLHFFLDKSWLLILPNRYHLSRLFSILLHKRFGRNKFLRKCLYLVIQSLPNKH